MKKYIVILFVMAIQQQLFSQSINSVNLFKLINYCDSTKADEILFSFNGNVLTHWNRTDFTTIQPEGASAQCKTPYMGTASMVKSWTGLLIGILIDQGTIKSVDDLVCHYIPEWRIACKNKITIKHLLTMSAGYKRLGPSGVLSQGNMNQYVINLKPDTLPGIRFNYSNESVQALGMVVEKASGLKADEAFQKYLFEPMDIDSTSFARDSSGNVLVYGGCITTVSNAHKIGMLMLNNGRYNNQQIVSEKWIKESITPSALAPYYGYLWWIDKNSKHWNFAATGDLGQMTIVFPELNLAFVRKQSCDVSLASRNMSWMGGKFLDKISGVVE